MNREPKFIAYDLETGGVNPKTNPILTGYFTVLSEDLVQLDELFLKIRPEDPYSIVEPDSLKVTKINLEEHCSDPETLARTEAATKLVDFINKNKPKRNKLIRMGYNISFDDKMIIEQLVPEWESILHYKVLDSFNTVNFLKDAEWLPQELGTLTSVVSHFNIPVKQAHDAKNDVLMSIAVYDRLKSMLVKAKNPNLGLSLDVLEIVER